MPDFVVDGKNNYERQAFLKVLEEHLIKYGRTVVLISKHPVKTPNDAKRYYRGVVLPYAVECFSSIGDIDYEEHLHHEYKKMFLPVLFQKYQYQLSDNEDFLDDDHEELTTRNLRSDIEWEFVYLVKNHVEKESGGLIPDQFSVIRRKPNPKDWLNTNKD